MSIIDRLPIDRPIHCRLKAVMRDDIRIYILDPFEVFDHCPQLIMPRNDRLGVDRRDRLVFEQYRLLP